MLQRPATIITSFAADWVEEDTSVEVVARGPACIISTAQQADKLIGHSDPVFDGFSFIDAGSDETFVQYALDTHFVLLRV